MGLNVLISSVIPTRINIFLRVIPDGSTLPLCFLSGGEVTMSDVVAKCLRCGNEARVSEYVSIESMTCPNCGSGLSLDKSTSRPAKSLTVLREKPTSANTPPSGKTPSSTHSNSSTPESEVVAAKNPKYHRRRGDRKKRRVGRFQVSDYMLSWILFIILAPILYELRYGEFFSGQNLEDVTTCGIGAFFLFYAVIVVEALREEVLDGILALFLPPYALYYLFFKSNSFFLRAILAAIAVGFCQDIVVLVGTQTADWYDIVTRWVGGGALK